MDADPGVKGRTVVAAPARVTLNRRQWVVLLQRRTHGRDQRTQAAGGRNRSHAVDYESAEPPTLRSAVEHRNDRAQRVCISVGEHGTGFDGVVHSARQRLDHAVPANRHRLRAAEWASAVLVVQDHLELREALAHHMPEPVAIRMVDELRPRIRDLFEAVDQVGALPVGRRRRRH